jgi:ssDNA-binding Zn-finger/Zn-ribbon topoisomerase 1
MDTLNESLEHAKQFLPEEEETCDKICPLCGAPMTIRRSRFGKLFYGCTNYPKCKGIVNKD